MILCERCIDEKRKEPSPAAFFWWDRNPMSKINPKILPLCAEHKAMEELRLVAGS